DASDGRWPEDREAIGQVTEAFAGEDRGTEGIERLGSRRGSPGSANFPVQRDRGHGFSARVAKELVFQTNLEIPETRRGRLSIGTELEEAASEREFEIGGQPLLELGSELSRPCARFAGTAWAHDVEDRRKGQLIFDEGLGDHELVEELPPPHNFLR